MEWELIAAIRQKNCRSEQLPRGRMFACARCITMGCIGYAISCRYLQCTSKIYPIPMYFVKGNSTRVELDQFPLKIFVWRKLSICAEIATKLFQKVRCIVSK